MKKVIFRFLISILFLAILPVILVNAQVSDLNWSEPVRLSSGKPIGEPASLVADSYGFVHVLWTEILSDERTILQYARYDGSTWSVPIDVYISPENFTISSLSPVVDQYGILHVVWTEGVNFKVLFSTKVSVFDTLSVYKWQEPEQTRIAADQAILRIDPSGKYHVLFSRIDDEGRGVYYMYSEDEGTTWSSPVWVDPDIPLGLFPASLSFSLDDSGGLHATWGYAVFDEDAIGGITNWIRYAHLLEGEEQWSTFTIDQVNEVVAETGYQLNAAGPVMIVSGDTVHVVWAGGKLHYRHHRYSTDAGRTWSEPTRIFGELNGQAFDGLILDGAGRVHYFGQIRFPTAIYHAVWENNRWTAPSVVYFIRFTDTDPPSEQVQAHATYPAILLGNQIVLTFTDPPPDDHRGLYVITSLLEDVAPIAPITPLAPIPTPASELTSTLQPTATLAVTSVPRTPTLEADIPSKTFASLPNQALLLGSFLSLLLVAGILVFRAIRQ
jgi:hypothetical protein